MVKAEVHDDRINIFFSTPNESEFYEILETVKDLPDRSFRKTPTPHWWVPATPYAASEVIRALKPLGFQIDNGVEAIAEDAHDLIAHHDEPPTLDIPELYDYQVKGVEFVEKAGLRAILGDDPGLGKTPQALVSAWRNRDRIGRVIVVAPANVTHKWKREVEQWTGWDAQVVNTSKEELERVWVHIMSYGIMRRRLSELLDWQYTMVILDEHHYIKNAKTKRTRAAKQLCAGTPYILGLSGTPMLNKPIELFNMLNILDPKAWKNLYSYGNRYCGGIGEFGYFQGATNLEELSRRLKTIMIRRTKQDVLDQLPDMTRTILPVDIPMGEYNKIRRNVQEAILELSPESKGYYVNVLDKLNLLRQSVGREKADMAASWAKDFLKQTEDNTKLMIYAHHRHVVDYLVEKLEEFGVTTITGDVSPVERDRRAEAFQTPTGPRVIITTSAAKEGIDLFGLGGVDASRLLMVEREWTPAVEAQIEGRLHRTGQKNAVEAIYLVANGTIDEYLHEVIEKKRSIIRGTVGEGEVETRIVDSLLPYLLDSEEVEA